MKALDIALKDLLQSFRSTFAVGMRLVAPLLITGLLYAAFSGISSGRVDLPALKVAVVNLDQPTSLPAGQPAVSQTLLAMLNDASVSSWLKVSSAADEASARAAIDRQEIGAALVIPAHFSDAVSAG